MVKDKRFYWELFAVTLQISAFTFGGGYMIISLMRRKFIQERGWLDEKEMLDLAAVAQSAPGSIAVNASLLLGYRLAGFRGLFVSLAGTVLPPLLIIALVSYFYLAFRNNVYAVLAMRGMQAASAAVFLDAAFSMAKGVFSARRVLTVIAAAAAFIAAFFFSVNVFLIIIACGAAGAADAFFKSRKRDGGTGGGA